MNEAAWGWPIYLSVLETHNNSRAFYCVPIASAGSADWLNRVKAGEY
jgi:hypothetical protein